MLYLTHLLNGLLMIAIPIGLGLYLTEKFNLNWRIWWIGAITFVLSQVGHIPFNMGVDYLFTNEFLPLPTQRWRLLFNLVFLGMSAGIWEETFRYIAYRWWVKDARSWRKALLLGAGHGGIEAIILGIIVMLTYFQMLALQESNLSAIAPPGQLDRLSSIVASYWSIPWYGSLLGSLERVFALITHLCLSVMVWQVINRNHHRWLLLAIGWHAFFNAGALYIAQNWGAYAAEGFLAVFALVSVWIIFRLYQAEPEPDRSSGQPVISPTGPIKVMVQIEESPENLEQTRYN